MKFKKGTAEPVAPTRKAACPPDVVDFRRSCVLKVGGLLDDRERVIYGLTAQEYNALGDLMYGHAEPMPASYDSGTARSHLRGKFQERPTRYFFNDGLGKEPIAGNSAMGILMSKYGRQS